jgi:hypothetical protein
MLQEAALDIVKQVKGLILKQIPGLKVWLKRKSTCLRPWLHSPVLEEQTKQNKTYPNTLSLPIPIALLK